MYRYCVSKKAKPTGEHEVHTSLCGYNPPPEDCVDLGEHRTCREAILKAREYYEKVQGCYFCCRECHSH
jgi:hypothetical protein